jgi:hypothetical protein
MFSNAMVKINSSFVCALEFGQALHHSVNLSAGSILGQCRDNVVSLVLQVKFCNVNI